MDSLEGKVAVVTGAASGIGRAMAMRFAAEGMRVVLADLDRPELDEALDDVTSSGVTAIRVVADVSDRSAVHALAETTFQQMGTAHVLCNNAGVIAPGPVWATPIEDWQWVYSINFCGALYGIHEFVPKMREQREGHVVNTASMGGLFTGPGLGPYASSKHALVAMTECLFKDLKAEGSNVSASILCPGAVRTPIMDSRHSAPSARQSASDAELAASENYLASGVDPAVVADQVVGAIRADRFWILTHPDRSGGVRERAEEIIAGQNPEPAYP